MSELGAGVIESMERRIALTGASNFRDLGGYETYEGSRTAWRRVFRADGLHDLTEDDVEQVVALGLGDVFDLRTDREREVFAAMPLAARGIRHHRVPFVAEVGIARNQGALPAERPAADDHAAHAASYLEMLEGAKPALQRVLNHLAEAPAEGAVFHCMGGRDRTGLTAALLLGVLGVPREVIAADYALTTEYLDFPEARRERMRELYGAQVMPVGQRLVTHAEVMTLTLEGLDGRYGSPEAYLLDAGVTADHQEALRRTLLEV